MMSVKKNKGKCIFDIGTNKVICLTYKSINELDFDIFGWSHKKSSGISKSRVSDVEKVSKTILDVADEMRTKVNIENITTNISDINSLQKKEFSEINIGGVKISKKEIRKSYKKSLQNSNLANKNLIHSIPLKFTIDNIQSLSDPLGIYGNNLGLNTYNIWIDSSIVKNIDNCFKNANLVVENIIDSSFASAEFCLTKEEKKIGSTCIDIGAGTAKIATYYKGNPEYINYIPLGGNDVTNDIEKGLEISKELAEYIKVLHGDLEHSNTKNIKLDLKDGSQKNITQNILHGIIKPRYEEIFEIIRDKLQDNLVSRVGVNQIVLTGGASQISGLADFAAKIFNRKTRLSIPNTKFSYLNKPEFSNILGLMRMKSDIDLKKIIKSVSNNKIYNLIENFDNWVKESFM